MLVAMVAKHDLLQTTEGKYAYSRALAILAPLDRWTIIGVDSFVEAADWPDKIIQDGNKLLNSFHFSNIPYFKDIPEKQIDRDPFNVIVRISDCIKTLQSKDRFKRGKSVKLFAQSIAVRYLIHLVGDLHMPLHASSTYSKLTPDGDLGGNLFNTSYSTAGVDDVNLHFAWDHVFKHFKKEAASPLDVETHQYMREEMMSLVKKWNRESLKEDLKKKDPQEWADESHQIVEDFVYKGLTSGGDLPEEYVSKATEIALKRIAKAGYRLADSFKNAFPLPPSSI